MMNALGLALAYHEAWTSGDFHRAADLLGDDLEVEVPINDYPTKESFVEALTSFGSQVTRADLLAQLGAQDEAMLLYDMKVPGLGDLRIAEHFTVSGGRISRLRQIHDTAPIRAAAPGPGA